MRPTNLLFALGTRATPRAQRPHPARRTVPTVVPDLTLLTLPRRHASLLLPRQPELLPKPRLARLRVRVRVRVRGKVRARVRVRVRVR